MTKTCLEEINFYLDLEEKRREVAAHCRPLISMFSESFFETETEGETPEKIICYMAQKLIEQEIVPNDFLEEVLRREKQMSTSFMNGYAIPHAFYCNGSSESFISVCRMKNPVYWNGIQVRWVFMMGLKSEEKKEALGIYSELVHSLNRLMAGNLLDDVQDFCTFRHKFQFKEIPMRKRDIR